MTTQLQSPVVPADTYLQPGPKWDPISFRLEDAASRSPKRRLQEAAAWNAAPTELPCAEDWARILGRTAIECLLGLRPCHQLARWVDERIYRAIARRSSLTTRTIGPQRQRRIGVKSASAYEVDEVTVEVCLTVLDNDRVRAAALRLEQYHGRWIATALEIA